MADGLQPFVTISSLSSRLPVYSETNSLVLRPGFPAGPIPFLITPSRIFSLEDPTPVTHRRLRNLGDVGSSERLNARYDGIFSLLGFLGDIL